MAHNPNSGYSKRRMKGFRKWWWLWIIVVVLVIYLFPVFPVLLRYAAFPLKPEQSYTFVLAGVTPEYVGYHQKGKERFSGLTDTILLLHYLPQSNTLKVLSVPRDTRMGNNKINSANARGGLQLMQKNLSNLTGEQVSGIALISLAGVQAVVDTVGGVKVYVPQDMKYTDKAAGLDIDLKTGEQVLNGKDAEGFMRFRYDDLGDIGRVQRQQTFLRAFLAQMQTPEGMWLLPRVIAAGYANTLSNLERSDASKILGILLSRPQLEMLKVPGSFATIGGVSYWEANTRRLHYLLDDQNNVNLKSLRIAILNLGAAQGSGARLQQKLAQQGFNPTLIRNVMNSQQADPRTTWVVSDLGLEVAQGMQKVLGQGMTIASGEGVLGYDITIRLGEDWVEAN